jgi:hypothetical protein
VLLQLLQLLWHASALLKLRRQPATQHRQLKSQTYLLNYVRTRMWRSTSRLLLVLLLLLLLLQMLSHAPALFKHGQQLNTHQ